METLLVMTTIKKVFPDATVICFKNNRNLKSDLVRFALPDIKEVGICELCCGTGPLCQSCNSMKNLSIFKSKHSNKVYQIKKNFDCNSKIMVYLIERRVCGKQCNGSAVTKFRDKTHNDKSTHRDIQKDKNCQPKAVTRNNFTNIISKVAITGFMTGKSQQ